MLLYIGVALLVVWRIAARIRRMVVRQPLTRWRPRATALLFSCSLLALMVLERQHPVNDLALLGGSAIGIALGLYGLRTTRFERTPIGVFYQPNAYLGIALSLLLLGRLAYRFAPLLGTGDLDSLAAADFTRSPLTLVLVGVLASYFVTYAVGLLRWRDDATATAAADANPLLPR